MSWKGIRDGQSERGGEEREQGREGGRGEERERELVRESVCVCVTDRERARSSVSSDELRVFFCSPSY